MEKTLVAKFKCPHCSMDTRAFETHRPPQEGEPQMALRVLHAELFDKAKVKAGDTVYVLDCLYDICLNCGVEYCYEINKIKVEIAYRNPATQNLFMPGNMKLKN